MSFSHTAFRLAITVWVSFFAFVSSMSTGAASSGKVRYVTIATGNETGVYFPTGGAICRLMNKSSKQSGLRCSVESTDGSRHNLNAIRNSEVDFAVVQSDWQYHAYHGTSTYKDQGPLRSLRSVFSIHPEAFTVVARADAKISGFEDLKGKRVNVGSPGTGQRGTMEVLMAAHGWIMEDFAQAGEINAADQPRALCGNKIDAMIYIVGHPSGAIKEATTLCESKIVSIKDALIDKLVKANPYYRKATIPGGMYSENPRDVETFGVGATFVTNSDTPDPIVYHLVKSVFENYDLFRRLHPALAGLNKDQMLVDGLTAPLHPGAVRYYKEVGLLP